GGDDGDVPVVTPAPAAAASDATGPVRILNVRTDVLDVDISLRGADIVRADLLEYPVKKGGDVPVRLLRNNGPGDQYVLQTGLTGAAANTQPGSYPTHVALFSTPFQGF